MPSSFRLTSGDSGVVGFLHNPDRDACAGLVLTHGAGSNCESPLLIAVAEAFAQVGVAVLRCDLPFRKRRPNGPPRREESATDREGLRQALKAMRDITPELLFLGGHSYGGRQASILAADQSGIAAGLLLLSYPLHPPSKPNELRTGHFSALHTPALFVHGSHDGFGSPQELKMALQLIPAHTRLMTIASAGHDLGFGGKKQPLNVAPSVVEQFSLLVGLQASQS